MTEADQQRVQATQKLQEGRLGAALLCAKRCLELSGAAAPVAAYALWDIQSPPTQGIELVAQWRDPTIASSARLIEGLPQFTQWAEPFEPPPVSIWRLPRCVALAPQLLLSANKQLMDDNIGYTNSQLCEHLPAGFVGVAAGHGHMVVALRHQKSVRVRQSVIYLPTSTNYAEWFFGCLPRLVAYLSVPGLIDLPILLHGQVMQYHRDSLRALGLGEERFIFHQATTRIECDELFYASATYRHHAHYPTGLRFLRDQMARAFPVPMTEAPARIYWARRHAHDRPLVNEADVVDLLAQYGFQSIDPEKHPFDVQVQWAASAQCVVGPYGANLTNLIFSGKARQCLILATKAQPEFARLASVFGMESVHLAVEGFRLREGRTVSQSYGFKVDLEALHWVIKNVLQFA